VLTQTKALADYFERCVSLYPAPKDVSNWIMTEVLRVLKEGRGDIGSLKVTPEMLIDLLKLLKGGSVSGLKAKEVFDEMASTGKVASAIIKERGFEQVSDEEELKRIVRDIIKEYPKEAASYRSGKTQIMGFFVGQVMKASKGKANPKLLSGIIKEMLEQ
jgi:aspartyl-tRNA(Asn)/glutamyl-tRNA(Gln) amidotransferase subunit B